jgi:hypothetical protein
VESISAPHSGRQRSYFDYQLLHDPLDDEQDEQSHHGTEVDHTHCRYQLPENPQIPLCRIVAELEDRIQGLLRRYPHPTEYYPDNHENVKDPEKYIDEIVQIVPRHGG